MIAKKILIDAGPLVASYRKSDEHHGVAIRTASELNVPMSSCWPVITEALYLVRESTTAVKSLLARIEAGDIRILPLQANDAGPIRTIMVKYHDQGVDFADACLVHLAEREKINTIFTLDRRHFSIYRTVSGEFFRVLPE